MPDEVVIYLRGEFGVPPAPVDEDVRDRVLSSPNGRRYEGWTRPQPSLEEIRESYGGGSVSDEELLLCYMVPAEDVAAARAQPVLADYPYLDETTELDLVNHLMAAKRPTYVHVSRGDNRITMRRAQ